MLGPCALNSWSSHPAVPNVTGRLPLSRPFHVRVMLPCYRESLELIQVGSLQGRCLCQLSRPV